MTISATTRPAFRIATATDEVFLKQLFSETNEALRWIPQAMRDALATMQYRARASQYAAMYPDAEDRILCLEDGTAAGRHLISHGDDGVRTIDIAVLPQYQRQGIASASLKQVQQECGQAGVAHRLSVAKENPASALYARLGFAVTSEDDVYLQMCCPAAASV